MDKQSLNMFNEVMSALSHMKDIDEKHEKTIIAEVARIKNGEPAPKKKEVVEDADKIAKSFSKE